MTNRQVFAWAGFSLELPADWNLSVAHGDTDAGTIAFADLRLGPLEVRWQSGGQAGLARRLRRLVGKMRRLRAKVTAVAGRESAWEFDHGDRWIVLLHIARRLYEISGPAGGPTAAEILASFTDAQNAELYRWRVYGIDAAVPAKWQLKKISLLPGASRLEFQPGWLSRSRLQTGSWSMADRLLGDASLEAWATAKLPLVAAHPGGRWESRGAGVFFCVAPGRWPGNTAQALALWRNRGNNCIVWLHTNMPRGRSVLAKRLLGLFLEGRVAGAGQ
jgi:hypothetical protein